MSVDKHQPGWDGGFKIMSWRRLKLVVYHQPLTIIVPLLVTATMIGVGVWGAVYGAHQQEQALQEKTLSFTEEVACGISSKLLTAFNPIYTQTMMAQWIPDWPTINPTFYRIESVTSFRLNGDAYLEESVSQLSPGGIVSISPVGSVLGIPLGTDMLSNAYLSNYSWGNQDDLVSSTTCIGPVQLGDEEAQLIVSQPVYLTNIGNADETFQRPYSTPNIANCKSCYNPETGRMFWGFVLVSFPFLHILEVYGFEKVLADANYKYRLTRNAYPRDDLADGESEVWIYGSEEKLNDPVVAEIEFNGNKWFLYTSVPGGWEQDWLPGVIVVVVVVSSLIGFLLMVVAVSSQERHMLLHAVAPKDLLHQLFTSDEFLRNFDRSRVIGTGSPADVMMVILGDIIAGREVSVSQCAMVRKAILNSQDLFTPTDLVDRLLAQLDDDVANNLMRELGAGISDHWKQVPVEVDSSQPSALLNGEEANTVILGMNDNHVSKDAERDIIMGIINRTSRLTSAPSSSNGLKQQPMPKISLVGTNKSRRQSQTSEYKEEDGPLVDPRTTPSPGTRYPTLLAQPWADTRLVDPHDSQISPSPCAPLYDEVETVLSHAFTSWHFDAFQLDDITLGHPLSVLGFFLLNKLGLVSKFKLNPVRLARCLRKIEAGYENNPYHSKTHAADVLQTLHVILLHGGLIGGYCDPLTHLACVLAAAVHDLEHIGFTNDYIIGMEHPLAIKYNDRSPMENHHLASAFKIFQTSGLDFFSHLQRTDRNKLRSTMIDLVLGTDMKQHFTIHSQFSTSHSLDTSPKCSLPTRNQAHGLVGKMHSLPNHRVKRTLVPASASLAHLDSKKESPRHAVAIADPADSHSLPLPLEQAEATQPVVPKDDVERMLALQIALKCADIGLIAEGLEVHIKWVYALEEEFYNQGDLELKNGLPISPLFDRTKPGVSTSQPGFFNFIAIPMFHNFCAVFPRCRPLMELISTNYHYWKAEEEPKHSKDPLPVATVSNPTSNSQANLSGSLLLLGNSELQTSNSSNLRNSSAGAANISTSDPLQSSNSRFTRSSNPSTGRSSKRLAPSTPPSAALCLLSNPSAISDSHQETEIQINEPGPVEDPRT